MLCGEQSVRICVALPHFPSDGWDWPEQATGIESRLIGKIFAVSTNPVEAEDLRSGIFERTSVEVAMAYASSSSCMQGPRAPNADVGTALSHSLPSPRLGRMQRQLRYSLSWVSHCMSSARFLHACATKGALWQMQRRQLLLEM